MGPGHPDVAKSLDRLATLYQARGLYGEAEPPRPGQDDRPPVKFSASPGGVLRGAPLLGEHTREVLAEHGFSDNEIERLIAERAVIAA